MLTSFKYGKVWEGGQGNIIMCTVADTEEEAISNLCEKEPILLAIGCTVAPMQDIDGYEIVARLPKD